MEGDGRADADQRLSPRSTNDEATATTMSNTPAYSLARLCGYFLKLGTVGFGGPVALVGYMYRDLVQARQWITDEDYKEGLTLAQIMPGPGAARRAM